MLRQVATQLDESAERLSAIYQAAGLPAETMAAWFDGRDHWLTADEALAVGLITGIAPTVAPPVETVPAGAVESPDNDAEGIRLLLDAVQAIGPLRVADKAAFARELTVLLTHQIR